MCLISKWKFAKKAKEDIVCFKVLSVDEDGNYYAPYMNNVVDISKSYKAKGISLTLFNLFEKGKGYIHTLKYCPSYKFLNSEFGYIQTIVYKCIIPKGTKYHEGLYGEYCSKKIIFKNLVPSYSLD